MNKLIFPVIGILALAFFQSLEVSRAAEFHVSPVGSDSNAGTQAVPLRTIQHAADLSQPGDTVTVHAGIYRERVNPPRGGESDAKRITYQAASGEKVVIAGSEAVKQWMRVTNDTWKVTLPGSFFGEFNPFAHRIEGEWCEPTGRHAGMVYLDGGWFAESQALEPVLKPAGEEALWFAKVEAQSTTLWAQFRGVNPNEADVEINKRQSVFYPSKPGVNYITVRGFILRQAATPWAGAMSEQVGLIGTHWSKGWIIESNTISHSMCAGVTLGRYELAKGEMPPATSPGFIKSVELAIRDGWSKERIGGHIVRNNRISYCEKNAIHGSLGAAFSEVSGNEIHDIAIRGWVRGADTGGIKFLGGLDMVIRDNHIFRCGDVAGIWLDWMAQGAHVAGNLLHDNRSRDIFCEMQHGPLVIANNILLSPHSLWLNSKGIAFAHNLLSGTIRHTAYDERKTPFHPPHATEIAGLYDAPSGDHRCFNNLVTAACKLQAIDSAKLPCIATGNVFTKGAWPSTFDTEALVKTGFDPGVRLEEKPDGWYLTLAADAAWRDEAKRKLVTTELLGKAKVPGCAYENPDGSPLRIDTDYLGKKRDTNNPFPGPFEISKGERQTIRVWPKP